MERSLNEETNYNEDATTNAQEELQDSMNSKKSYSTVITDYKSILSSIRAEKERCLEKRRKEQGRPLFSMLWRGEAEDESVGKKLLLRRHLSEARTWVSKQEHLHLDEEEGYKEEFECPGGSRRAGEEEGYDMDMEETSGESGVVMIEKERRTGKLELERQLVRTENPLK